MPETSIAELRVADALLRKSCDKSALQFDRSDEVEPGKSYLGQQRAIEAIEFGIRLDRDGYNIFVLGPPGSHRHKIAEDLCGEQAKTRAAPDDWCYVHNFSDPEQPRALSFGAGLGRQFRDDMGALIEELKLAIPAAFEGEDYRTQLKAIEAATEEEVSEKWKTFERQAAAQGIGVLQTPTGYVLAPVKDDEVIEESDFAELPEAEREQIQQKIHVLTDELQTYIEMMPRLRKQYREQIKTLNRDVTDHVVRILITELKQKYHDLPCVTEYLGQVQQDIVDHSQDFREPAPSPLPFLNPDESRSFRRYEINLIVSNDPTDNAPVVYEQNPNYPNLIGKVEHRAEMGALVTDFAMVRAGALLAANGGYLILDAHRALGRPFTWDALKQALSEKCVRIESPGESLGFVSTMTLRPQPIPLDIKIILIGERWLYYLLSAYDSEFRELFNVAADLDDDLERSDEHVAEYARMIAGRVSDRQLLPFDRAAVARVIDQRARTADDSERLSMHMRSLDDLLAQADYWARHRESDLVEAEDIGTAIEQQRKRLNRTQIKVIDAIDRQTLLIDTEGACVGQVNGLSVIDLGEYRFGHPVRVTATTRIGTGDVVDIEREVELGGAIHSKGMMILSSALASRYVSDHPLSLHASVVFEQSYGGVDGDSASVAELCALLSSLSKIPILQNMAVTGSINQLGRVQVVGGINEKIEGFYDVCEKRGLD
ncbi:MAG: AAA family ATPase, partial [Gammaproteobacteria bacterium]|nr:AAA family ATPase [Gammaproteobacteria bacterium]